MLIFFFLIQGDTTVEKWRNTLLKLVARCYSESLLPIAANAIRWNLRRNKRTNYSSSVNVNSSASKNPSFYLNLPSEFSPVVVVHDILETKHREAYKLSKNNYFDYLKLSDNCLSRVNSNVCVQKHYMDLTKIPFSSDLGKKLIEKRRKDVKITQKKLKLKQQIIEKYCGSQNMCSTSKKSRKMVRFSPMPNVRRSERRSLSIRTKFLMKMCNPCVVTLTNLNIAMDDPQFFQNTQKFAIKSIIKRTISGTKENNYLLQNIKKFGTFKMPIVALVPLDLNKI